MAEFRFWPRWRAVVALLALALSASFVSAKESRVALVIGNSSYANVTPLKNAVTDADAVAANLATLGFEVIKATNATRGRMNEAIGHFLDKAGPDTDAVIYFAGHGVELSGANYLLPIDVPGLRPGQERLLRAESISLTELLTELEGRQSRVSIVVLDACRDNPFPPQGTRSLGSNRGLARVDPPAGAFVVFSAGAGEQALDVLGPEDKNPNGVFTRRFLSLINEPGLELRQMVLKLRTEVSGLARGINHKQMPSYYDQMSGSFYFRQTATIQASAAPAPSGPPRGMARLNTARTFNAPQIDGKPLDWCLTWSKECGFPAADAFCKAQGALRARLIQRMSARETKLIGEDRTCSGATCSTFRFVNCVPADTNLQMAAGAEALLYERQVFDVSCQQSPNPAVVIDRQPALGGVEVRNQTWKTYGQTGSFAHCNGLEFEGVRVVYKAPPDLAGPVKIEFRSRLSGQTDHFGSVEFEVVKPPAR